MILFVNNKISMLWYVVALYVDCELLKVSTIFYLYSIQCLPNITFMNDFENKVYNPFKF